VVGISKFSILWEKASATFFAQLDCFKPLLLASNCALNLQLVPINIGPSSSSQIPPFQQLTRNRRDLDRLFLDVFGQCKQLTFWQSHFNFNREFFEGHPFVNGLPVLKVVLMIHPPTNPPPPPFTHNISCTGQWTMD
jgi:hypothetical protein